MFNQGMIPVSNGGILHRLVQGKTKSAGVIKIGMVSVGNAETLMKLHYLSHSRLVREIQLMKTRYPDLELRSNGVNTPVDKQGRTPLNKIPNVIDTFKKHKKGSNYY